MEKRNIGRGVLFVVAGVVWLLINMGYIKWWSVLNSLSVLWPLIFVVIGINIIFRKNAIVYMVVWLLFVATVIGYSLYIQEDSYLKGMIQDTKVLVEKLDETRRGEMEITVGGINIEVGSDSKNLINGEFSDSGVKSSTKYKDGNEIAVVKISNPRTKVLRLSDFNRGSRDGRLLLNSEVEWELDVKAGAVNGIIDMSDLKVEDFDADVGAGNITIVFGSNISMTKANIDAGASKVQLVVPESSGVRIKAGGILNNTNLDNLGWNREGNYYVSPNYAEAKNKIDINMSMGIGKLDIKVQDIAV